ncbi:MAG: hypothetical protein ACK5Q5_16750 [Planctomycetaceae bacterium]
MYRKTKHSEHPGPRASNVSPARHGDGYSYTVDKYWVVREVLSDGSIRLRTRRGKEHTVAQDDLCLRHANFIQRLLQRGRFAAIEKQDVGDNTADETDRADEVADLTAP